MLKLPFASMKLGVLVFPILCARILWLKGGNVAIWLSPLMYISSILV